MKASETIHVGRKTWGVECGWLESAACVRLVALVGGLVGRWQQAAVQRGSVAACGWAVAAQGLPSEAGTIPPATLFRSAEVPQISACRRWESG